MKTLKLVKSELIKLFSKKSTYIFIIGMVVITVISCIAMKFNGNTMYAYVDGKYINEKCGYLLESIKGRNDETAVLVKKILEKELKIFEEKESMLSGDLNTTWRREVFDIYSTCEMNLFGTQLIRDGYTSEKIENALYEIQSFMYSDEIYFSAVDAPEYVSVQQKGRDSNYKILKDNDFLSYAKDKKEEFENISKDYSKELDILIKDKDSKTGNELVKISEKIDELKNKIEAKNGAIEVYDYFINNPILNKKDNWKYNVLLETINYYDALARGKSNKLTEKEYYESYEYQNGKLDYKTYLEKLDLDNKNTEEKIAVNWYSVKNNMPQVGIFSDDSAARTIVNGTLSVNIFGIICVVIAGALVSHEFSTGTIRFLITRPVKRYKILLAKLIALLLFMLCLMAIYFVTDIVTAGIVGGFTNFAIPDLAVQNGKVVESSFILNTIGILLISTIPVLFFIVFAFTISTIFPITAVAVGLGMGGWFACYIAGEMYVSMAMAGSRIASKFAWLKYTPVPYVNISNYLNSEYAFNLSKTIRLKLGAWCTSYGNIYGNYATYSIYCIY